MKNFFYAALIPAFLLSCNGNKSDQSNTTGGDSASIMADSSGAKMDAKDNSNNKMNSDTAKSPMTGSRTVSDKDVSSFVEKASSVGMMEVELGNYAAQNAKNQRVKDFGKMMVTDHTAAGNELKAMATSNGIMVPSTMREDHQMHVDMLKKKTGSDFDKDYIDMMVNGHKETIAMFKNASTELTDASYKAFAMKTLPVLQKHLDAAQAIQKSL